jgi:hypothetical protein
MCLIAAALAPSSQAAPVYDTTVAPANYTGSRSTPTEIIAGGDWSTGTVSWVITTGGVGDWTYTYTFSADWDTPAISHFILDLSDNCTSTSGCVSNIDTDFTVGKLEYGTFGPGSGNPGFPAGGSITGVKFDDLEGDDIFEFTFDSTRAPVWGDFYIKGGSEGFAYNAGLTKHATSEDIAEFIARPDTTDGGEVPEVPEPSTVLLMGGSLLALGYFRKRRNS